MESVGPDLRKLEVLTQPIALKIQSFVVDRGGSRIIDGLTLTAPAGKIIGILGANGSGKTTLLSAMFGLIPITSGTVEVGGDKLEVWTPDLLAKHRMFYVPQGGRVFATMSVRENLRIAWQFSASSSQTDCEERAFAVLPEVRRHLKRRAGDLSGGQRQMIGVAGGLGSRAKVLLLDEPTSSLSEDITRRVYQALRERCALEGLAAVVVEHKAEYLNRYAHQVLRLAQGRLELSDG